MDYRPSISCKKGVFEQNAWIIAHPYGEKWAFFEQNAWIIAHPYLEKCAFLSKMHGL